MGKFAYKEVLQVKGYPPSLKIIKHGKSRFYWVHFSTYIASKGTVKIRKSTKTENQSDAIKFAKDFYEELYARHNIKGVLCGIIPPEASGWFREEIKGPEDLKGLKMRFFGLGAKVME